MRHLKRWLINSTPARLFMILSFLTLLIAAVVLVTTPVEAERPWMAPEEPPIIIIDEYCCTCDDCEQNGCEEVEKVDRAEFEMSRERMVAEVEMLWTMFFDDDNAKTTDPRRDRFPELAEYLVDYVIMYQDTPTDIGGQLPRHKNDHLVAGYMAAKESSMTPAIVNNGDNGKGEVCLFQLHGRALAGYSPDKVRHNARLCTMLGVRWITAQIPRCSQDGAGVFGETFAWEDSDWVGPLSVYAGGPRAIRKDGRCARFTKMAERVDAVRIFRTRIDYEMDFREE